MFAEIDLSGVAELASEIGLALWAFGMTPAGKITYMVLGLLYVVGMAKTSVVSTASGAKWAAGLFSFGKVSEVCQNACNLLLGADTQTDQKKLGINGLGQETTETTVKAGLLVITLESGGIVLHGTDLAGKLSRRERRRILSVARYVRKRILATERERDRQVAAHLLKGMGEPPNTGLKSEVFQTPGRVLCVPTSAEGVPLSGQAPFNGDPYHPGPGLSPATRRLDEGCGSSGNGKPVSCAGSCPGCR